MKTNRLVLLIVWVCLLVSPLTANRSEEVAAVIARMADLKRFQAGVNITSGESFWSGTLSYDAGRIHLALNDRRVIASDGKFLYVYDPNSKVVGKQELEGNSAGLEWLLKGYLTKIEGNTAYLVAESGAARYREVHLTWAQDKTLQKLSIRPRGSENWTTVVINNLQEVSGFPDSLFTLQAPRGVRVIFNPLSGN